MTIKFNVEPYYDDFESATTVDGLSPKEKYYQVLFRPSHAVQARELTQLQSILQNQVTQFGRHIFEEGSMVIPGAPTYENEFSYVKLADSNPITSTDLENLVGRIFEGDSSGVRAKVVKAVAAENTDPFTLYVNYTSSDSSNISNSFTDGEGLTEVVTSGTPVTATVASSDATGLGSAVSLDNGIYFIKGRFVEVQADTIILDKYSNDASYDVGLSVTEAIQTPAGDASLNDNAAGTPNDTAPGAHRYQIKTQLVKQDVEGSTYSNFVLLTRIKSGQVVREVRATEYSVIEDTLARRTFDESGNYTVRPFRVSIKENAVETKVSAMIEPSKAYVRGYEIETLETEELAIDKARETSVFEDASLPTYLGNYIDVTNVEGLPDIEGLDDVELHNVTKGSQSPSTIIGYARIRAMTTVGSGVYRLFLFHIRMNTSQAFDSVKSFKQANTPEFVADSVLDNNISVLKQPSRNSLIYRLPFERVKQLNDGGDYDFDYDVVKFFAAQPISSGDVRFNAGANETFILGDTNFIVIDEDGNIVTPTNIAASGTPIELSQVTISISGYTDNDTFSIIANVHRTAEMKQKSLVNRQVSIAPVAFINGVANLGEADIIRINSATMDGEDVTEYFNFDSGQRDNFYNIGSLILKPGVNLQITDDIEVDFDYFDHIGDGDFFCVDSYNLNEIDYEDIPRFISSTSGDTFELRSCVDFRPRMGDAGDNFTSGAVIGLCPRPNATFNTDIEYYLPRIDKVYLDKNGVFGVVKGVSALSPELPEDPKDAMVLYNLFVPAYTVSPDEVRVSVVDNKRYTMRDIGKLEKRINSLEYYTALSFLEKEAADKQILDPNTGSARFKNGFLVDSFSTHNVSRSSSDEFRAAIDRDARVVRPLFNQGNVRLIYNDTYVDAGVQKTGPLVTLPYTETNLVNQSSASDLINVNPFDVFKWTGTLEVSPTSDEWIDTTRRPNLIVDQEGVFDAMMAIIDETDALGTTWGNWETNWTGSPVVVDTFDSRSGRRVDTIAVEETQIGQTRRGIETSVVPDTIETNIGDRVVEINFAPYIRSRIVHFKATRMKPNTKVIPYFDGVDVSAFCREESQFYHYEDLNNPVLDGKNTITAHPVGSGDLITDASGTVTGSFFIPNNASTFFQTGSRVFKLEDSLQETDASVTYHAKGLIETKENVTISTRVPLIEKREVTNNRIITDTNNRITRTRWVDPLAQSFMIDLEGGAMLTSIEVYFATKDANIPVTLQIREMNQGLPTQTVVPFSEVTLYPNEVNTSDENDPTPDSTKFTFPAPVYLQEGQEYCFVLMANSNEYRVWYAGIGEDDYLSGDRISKQPYAGVLFLSQNASTWTPDQNKDMKFKLNRAQFTATSGKLYLDNGVVSPRQLNKNPLSTSNNSFEVIVRHKSHGMFEGDKVTIANATDVNNLLAANINRDHYIYDVEPDKYKINVNKDENNNLINDEAVTGVQANVAAGVDGGSNVTATENKVCDLIHPIVQHINFPGTNTTWTARGTLGGNLMQSNGAASYTDDTAQSIIVNKDFQYVSPRVIASATMQAERLNNDPSFVLTGTFTRPTNQDNISPIVDLERCSVITVANRIDNPASTASGSQNDVTDFTAETASSGGSCLAKYVTKNVNLAETSSTLKIFLDVNRPTQTEFDVYYRVSVNEDTIDEQDWVEITPESGSVPFSDDTDNYSEVEYTVDTGVVFSTFAIKLVMRSQNTSRVPTARDLRAIALA